MIRPTMIHMLPNYSLNKKKTNEALTLVRFESLETLKQVYKILHRKEILTETKQPIQIGLTYDSRCNGE